ncbi:MAG TPA: DUF1553 domain-containing protein [Planctomycetaceae bacterium]|nr:DUF1553 domain-containing protein [Planctomycetaceae bacterium]
MNLTNGRHDELWRLLEAVCEDELAPAQVARLEELLLADREARRFYLDYIGLHGSLYWDTAVGSDGEAGESPVVGQAAGVPSRVVNDPKLAAPATATGSARGAPRRRAFHRAAAAAVAVLVALGAAVVVFRVQLRDDGHGPAMADRAGPDAPGDPRPPDAAHPEAIPAPPSDVPPSDHQPFTLPGDRRDSGAGQSPVIAAAPGGPAVPAPSPVLPAPRARVAPGSVEAVVAVVNERLRAGWRDVVVEPSPQADDSEWIRRVYLDLVGQIPPADDVERFLDDRRPAVVKRAELIDRLLDEPAYVRHWTTVMTNLLIGRSLDRDVNRPALEKFFRDSFAANRPWNEIAADLVAAEGPDDENGAATFLIAHLNNQAVPATAITARIFLGVQVGCMQCHDHPLNRDWKQEQFWALNSLFKQTKVERTFAVDPRSGRRAERTELVSLPVGDLTYFETPRGVVKAVTPEFFDQPIDPGPEVNRRRELARLMFDGPQPLAARAIVNRLWAHFFGYGFTRPVDDMGPHNPPTHPELLADLADRFVESGYDLQALMRWITRCDAYHLTSRAAAGNAADLPDTGEPPAFSRMYLKPMTAEQLYDSVLVATRADLAAGSSWESVSRRRQEWLQQFVHAFDTEENDEATHFEGTIPQALVMMNGDLVRTAVASDRGTFFAQVAADRTSDVEKIRKLCLAALSRYPTERELRAIRGLVRTAAAQSVRTGRDPQAATIDCLRDVFWACLNSSEFRLVH